MSTTSEPADLYVMSLRARHVPTNTIKAYTHDLRHFLVAVSTDLTEVTVPLIQPFLEGDGHLSTATLARRHSTLCAFYQWMMWQEIGTFNPVDRLDPILRLKREPSPLAHDVIQLLLERTCTVVYNSEYVPSLTANDHAFSSQPLANELLASADCVAIVTDHNYYDIPWIIEQAKSIVDTHNTTNANKHKKIVTI